MVEPTIAVVVPVLDEARHLRQLLPELLGQADFVVVSDGGSRDGSAELASDLGAHVVIGSPGRGRQLNRGAEAARHCGGLLFLHADTHLPPDGLAPIRKALSKGAVGGGFLVRFDDPRRLMRFGERMVNLRTRFLKVPLGDQAQFASRGAFDTAGGFRDWPILEDLDFVRRLGKLGPLHIVDRAVTTSARRFQDRGILRTVALNWLIVALYSLGVPPRRLAHLYDRNR